MSAAFADTYFFFLLVNQNEAKHAECLKFLSTHPGMIWTTEWVLTELADGMCHPRTRGAYRVVRNSLFANPKVVIEPWGDELFNQGIDLDSSRPDKHWSLTDCISFVVMEREGIREALTGDHHFEPAGFNVLFTSP